MGSPPLTRGKYHEKPHQPHRPRLTPAYAGKIGHDVAKERLERAHPRLRGENSMRFSCIFVLSGSPPLTRGKFNQRRRHLRRQGLTPAYAGKIPACLMACVNFWAHPRLRGENV